ncbi:hypothetical protein BGZ61DRAFT_535962 [Ilyonectria robusta]|uniref:uncharacterized protein n=1 Tax=Ilyonectria robusta TaxID=1079257 RepID=UPI001E8E196B|nr:uncharacterized protein BGZ61DRAFT_535962 [Ilyonectria robusta]KAH8676995.1 hypothetical protein BGZ61DRAFT_535962 [Ilyonectria robusta]
MQVKPARRLDIATRITQPSFVRASGIILQPSNLEIWDHYQHKEKPRNTTGDPCPAVVNTNMSPPSLPPSPEAHAVTPPPCRSQLGCIRPIPSGGTFAEVDNWISLADPSFLFLRVPK